MRWSAPDSDALGPPSPALCVCTADLPQDAAAYDRFSCKQQDKTQSAILSLLLL